MLWYILRPNFRLLQVDKKACQIVAALQCTMDCCMYQIDFRFRFNHAFSRREENLSNCKGTVNFLCISVWHMWVWYLGEPDDAGNFKCDIAIKKRNVREEESELKYSGRVHSIRIPPHRIILSGCLLSFSDYTAAHFRYIGKFSWTFSKTTGCLNSKCAKEKD